MAHVTVTVNGRNFKMACRDGEEARVLDLAAEIDAQVQKIKGNLKLVPDDRLFLMAAMLMADQLWDSREEMQRIMRQMGEYKTYQIADKSHYAPQQREHGRGHDHHAASHPSNVEAFPGRLSQTGT